MSRPISKLFMSSLILREDSESLSFAFCMRDDSDVIIFGCLKGGAFKTFRLPKYFNSSSLEDFSMRIHMHMSVRLEFCHAYFLIWFLCGLEDRREGVTGVQRPLEDSPALSDDVGQSEISAGASQW